MTRPIKKNELIKLSQNGIWNKAVNSKGDLKTIIVMVHVLQTRQNLVISRCCFAEDGKEMYQEL